MDKESFFQPNYEAILKGALVGGLGLGAYRVSDKLIRGIMSKIMPKARQDIVIHVPEDAGVEKYSSFLEKTAKWLKFCEKKREANAQLVKESKGDNALIPSPQSMSNNFWAAMGFVPGVYLTHKLLKRIEKGQQDKEYQQAVNQIQDRILRRDMQKVSSADLEIMKDEVVRQYICGFQDGFEKEAGHDMQSVQDLGRSLLEGGWGMLKGISDPKTYESVLNAMKGMGTLAGMSLGGVANVAPAAYGAMVPMGYLLGNYIAEQQFPYEEDEDNTPSVTFKKIKRRKKPF